MMPNYATLLRRFFFFFSIICLNTHLVFPQQTLLDSLHQRYETAPNDSIKAVFLGEIIQKMIRINPDSALVLSDRNIDYAKRAGLAEIEGQGYIDKARSLVRLGKYEEAISFNLLAKSIFEGIPDSILLTMAYQGLGINYRHLGRFEASMQAQLTVVEILQAVGGSRQRLARAYNNIAAVHAEIGAHSKAIEFFRKSLEIWRKEKNPESMAICYINIGGQAVDAEDFKLAEENLSQGLQIFDSLGLQYGIGAAAANLGNLYMKHDDYTKARQQFKIALKQYQELGDKGRVAMFLSDLALAEAGLQNYTQAIRLQKDALKIAEEVNRLTAIRDIQERLSDLYGQAGDFEKAFAAQKKFYVLSDSIFNENTANQLHELEAKYEAEKKDREIEFLKKEQILQENEKSQLILGLVLLFLLSAISLYALVSSRTANKKLQIAQEKGHQLLGEKEDLISTLKQTQLRLIQKEKMASLGQLSAGIAHEINNPVNFVNGNAEALHLDLSEIKPILVAVAQLSKREDPSSVIQELQKLSATIDTDFLLTEILQLTESIQRGSSRIQTIVSSLKSFSHSSGEEFQEIDLNEILDATLNILTHKLRLKETKLVKNYGEIPKIYCQPGKISQVTMNMLDNAIDAIEKEGEIRISTKEKENKILLKISDNGSGIDEISKNKVFDPFFTTKELGEGTGLGLSISYGIIKDHGGEIQVDSELGEGTSFEISLPIGGLT